MTDAFQQHKHEVLQLFADATALARRRGQTEIAERMSAAAQRLREGKLLAVVAGEFKQGKSSLLNALLDDPERFPTDIDVATSVVSTIEYGPSEQITVHLRDAEGERELRIGRDEIRDYVTEQGNPGNQRGVRLLRMAAPLEKLNDGLILVDTPGIGGVNQAHNEATYTFLPSADCVLYVSDVQRPLKTDDLEFLAERILPHCPQVVHVVTKIDHSTDVERILEGNRQKLARALNKPEDQIDVLAVSSRLKLDYLESGEEEDLEDSNFPALEKRLWTLLNERRGRVLLSSALGQIGDGLAAVLRPLEAELEAFQNCDDAELQKMEAQAQEAAQRRKALSGLDAPWRIRMRDGIQDVRSQLPGLWQDQIVQVKRAAERLLDSAALLAEPKRVVAHVEALLDRSLAHVGSELEARSRRLHQQLLHETCFDLNPFEVRLDGLDTEDIKADPDRIRKPNWWEDGFSVVRSAMFQGGMVGGVLGWAGIAFNPLAAGIGIAGLLAVNAVTALNKTQDKARAALIREINQFIDQCARRGNGVIQDAITSFERSVRDEVEGRIQRELEELQRTIDSVREARRMSEKQAQQRLHELKSLASQAQQLRRQLERLGASIQGRSAAAERIQALRAKARGAAKEVQHG